MTIKAKVPKPKSGYLESGKLPLINQGDGKIKVLSREDQVFINLYKAVEKEGMFERVVEGMRQTDEISPQIAKMVEVVIAEMKATKDLDRKRKLFNFVEVVIAYYAGSAKQVDL